MNIPKIDQSPCSFASFVYSYNLDTLFSVKICNLIFCEKYKQVHRGSEWFYVEALIESPGLQPCLSIKSKLFKPSYEHNVNEWLELPVSIIDLISDSALVLKVWTLDEKYNEMMIGKTEFPIFSSHGEMKSGTHFLPISLQSLDRTIDDEVEKVKNASDQAILDEIRDLTSNRVCDVFPHVNWLDRCTFDTVEKVKKTIIETSSFPMICIEMPVFHDAGKDCIVIYSQRDESLTSFRPNNVDRSMYYDPEIDQDNVYEKAYQKLVRNMRLGFVATAIKPDPQIKERLKIITSHPAFMEFTREEKDLLWQYRYYLKDKREALPKFLLSVNFDIEAERLEALRLLDTWTPLFPSEALELLTPDFVNPDIRAYAVSRLDEASDEHLILYMLQLVQSLRYDSKIEKLTKYFSVDIEAQSDSTITSTNDSSISSNGDSKQKKLETLSEFMIRRCLQNDELCSTLYWDLTVAMKSETDDAICHYYSMMLKFMSIKLIHGCQEMCKRRRKLGLQTAFLTTLDELSKTISSTYGNRQKKTEILRQNLEKLNLSSSPNQYICIPFLPSRKFIKFVPDKSTLLNSTRMPFLITLADENGSEYSLIYKYGDDLRQDQLIIQMICLMNKLLLDENMDMSLIPYQIISTDVRTGLVEFVPSQTVAQVLRQYGTIQDYFRNAAPSPDDPLGISRNVMNTYIYSCAGYSIITYLLGIGDRHFDNLLLTTSGNLFHIDFSFILGSNPKPFSPPIKLSSEMIEAMGGLNHELYKTFRKLCFSVFLQLRKKYSLIVSLFAMMVDSKVAEIALEPDKAVQKLLERFHIDLTEEEALKHLQNIIDASINAIADSFVEQIHKIVQLLR